ncbi:MAG: hypothetical protein ACQCN6_07335 [Candidatus Bathyarchaeia archaeon]
MPPLLIIFLETEQAALFRVLQGKRIAGWLRHISQADPNKSSQ